MNLAVTGLPRPSKTRASCAWCRHDFATVIGLLGHVEAGHLQARIGRNGISPRR
jgi:hypothetical protein